MATRTILFTDLVASTELRSRLGDDRFDALRRAHDDVIARSVAANQGSVIKWTGDGAMATFDGASEALSAGSAIVRGMRALGERPEVRIGISAGDVVEEDDDCHGTPVVEAARLCDAANDRTVLCSDIVRALAGSRGGHSFTSAGALDLKGLPGPVVAWSLDAADATGLGIPLPPPLARERQGFAGRVAEREQLAGALERAVGERILVSLVGEPGIGKTRLATETLRAWWDGGATVLFGRCDEIVAAPYQPWREALDHLVEHAPDDLIDDHIARHGAVLRDLTPSLTTRRPDLDRPADVDADSARLRLYEAVDGLLGATSTRAPLVVTLDDVHWADAPSLTLLRYLLRVDAVPLLILTTYRDTDVDRRHPLAETLADLRRDVEIERIGISGLPTQDLAGMVTAWSGQDAPAEFVARLHAHTEGNPFFAGEVMRHLVEAGTITQSESGWAGTVPLADLGLPEGVRDVLGRRLSHLPEGADDVLSVAALIGREFDLSMLTAVAGIDRDAVLDAVEAASAARLVVDAPGSPGTFAFAHALVRQTLLEEIGTTRRVRLHWRIGEALAQVQPDALDTIAYHLTEGVLAGDATVVTDAALRAGEAAAEVAAAESALASFDQALAVLDQAGATDPDRRCRALMGIGHAASALMLASRQEAGFAGAAEIALTNGWTDVLVECAIGLRSFLSPPSPDSAFVNYLRAALEQLDPADAESRARVTGWLAAYTMSAPTEVEAIHLSDASLSLVDTSVDSPISCDVLLARCGALLGSSDIDQWLDVSSRALAMSRRLDDPNMERLALYHRVPATLQAGDRDVVEECHEGIRALLRRWPTRRVEGLLQVAEATLALSEGRLDEAATLIEASNAQRSEEPWANMAALTQVLFLDTLCETDLGGDVVGLIRLLAQTEQGLGLLSSMHAADAVRDVRSGELETARHHLDAATSDWTFPHARAIGKPLLLATLADAMFLVDEARDAARLSERLRPYSGQILVAPGGSVVLGAADRYLAMLVSLEGRHDEADDHFDRALAREEAFGALVATMFTRVSQATALLRRPEPDRERAAELARAVRADATRIGAKYFEIRVDHLLASLPR